MNAMVLNFLDTNDMLLKVDCLGEFVRVEQNGWTYDQYSIYVTEPEKTMCVDKTGFLRPSYIYLYGIVCMLMTTSQRYMYS